MLEDRKTLPAKVRVLQRLGTQTLLEVILVEGRNRQIRKVADQLEHPVKRLHRTEIGSIRLNPPGKPPLPSGRYRLLKSFEIRF